MKRFDVGKGLLPTCGAGDGDREPLPRPLPSPGSCKRSMGVVERSLVEREVRFSDINPKLLKMQSAEADAEVDWRHQMASWPIPQSGVPQGGVRRRRHQWWVALCVFMEYIYITQFCSPVERFLGAAAIVSA